MVTCLIVLAAVCLVVVAFQVSCFFSYEEKRKDGSKPSASSNVPGGCTEP